MVLTFLAIAFPRPSWAARYAILIGVSDYTGSGLHDLPGARHDIERIQGVLQQRLGYSSDQIHVLIDEAAGHTAIEQAFADLDAKVKQGDTVYIHYSGHGSRVTDQNDDEPDGQDETIVSWGARNPDSEGLDRFDILDDELNAWLAPIAARAEELVFVADACHSATATRGEHAPISRAAPPDEQLEHPRAKDPAKATVQDLASAVRVGAADIDQSAMEIQLEDGTPSGLFTWYWAGALQSAELGETWRQIFDRAALQVALMQGNAQRPQIAGANADRPLMGGTLDPRPAIAVSDVRGKQVSLNAGRLSGVTVGSLYADDDGKDAALVRISESYDSWSRGDIEQGELETGDFLSERERAFETAPLRLFALSPDLDNDQALARTARKRLSNLSGYVWADTQIQSDLVLALVRPTRDADGSPEFETGPDGRASLPTLDPGATPELWVLTPGEALISERLITPLDHPREALEQLAENLERYRRQVELRRLSAETGAEDLIRLELIVFEPCQQGESDCKRIRDDWLRERLTTIDELREHEWAAGSLISFVVENLDIGPRYIYLFELAPDGSIHAIFPNPRTHEASVARLDRGQRLSLAHPSIQTGLVMDSPGQPALLGLATQQPIDPRLLEQPGFAQRQAGEATHRGVTKGSSNPLEQLLATAINGSQTRSAASWGTGSWGGMLIDYEVKAPGDEVKTTIE